MPTISIIIPFRNNISLVNTCLQSMAASAGPDEQLIEVVLVDNGSDSHDLDSLKVPDTIPFTLIRLDIPFNYHIINNEAAKQANGKFLLFLNNDIIFTKESKAFASRLLEIASRPEVGAVGPRLMYEDGTIQHAGVVVGMGGTADHLYRGWTPQDTLKFPFTKYSESRAVSAVTGAFLMVSQANFEKIGGFDERFVICGGDVDLCLRLSSLGLINVYVGDVSAIHLESKTRDPRDIPHVDFEESARSYGRYLSNYGGRDPYYPAPLPLTHAPLKHFLTAKRRVGQSSDVSTSTCGSQSPGATHDSGTQGITSTPKWHKPLLGLLGSLTSLLGVSRDWLARYLAVLQRSAALASNWLVRQVGRFRRRKSVSVNAGRLSAASMGLPHMRPIRFHQEFSLQATPRLSVLLPHLEERAIYGGISTAALLALKFKSAWPAVDLRFILTDGEGSSKAVETALGSYFSTPLENLSYEIVVAYDRANPAVSVNVHQRDVFMATAWWTCYSAQILSRDKPFIYLIQDYEPCFYPWGEEFAGAAHTYGMDFVPIFNSSSLAEYFEVKSIVPQHVLTRGVVFEPAINRSLFARRAQRAEHASGKHILLLYGRPSVARNLFSTACQALAQVIEAGAYPATDWLFLSAGEPHSPIDLGHGATLTSLGKLSLAEYSRLLESVDLGLSLMLSPHPSYPPLEMASRGAVCVTNSYENKDLSRLHANIISCKPDVTDIARGLTEACNRVTGDCPAGLSEGRIMDLLSYDWDSSFDSAIACLASNLGVNSNAAAILRNTRASID